jgi:hypothetical protein
MKKVIKNLTALSNSQRRVYNLLSRDGWELITLNGYVHFLEDNAVEMQKDRKHSTVIDVDGNYKLPNMQD